METITISRPFEKINTNRSYKIKIGEHILAELKNGESKTIEIPKDLIGQPLQVKMDWLGSHAVNIEEKQIISIHANKFLHRILVSLGAIFPLSWIVMFNLNLVPKEIGIGGLLLLLLGLIGTLTIWKNEWLIVK